jgi:hypothetical protein
MDLLYLFTESRARAEEARAGDGGGLQGVEDSAEAAGVLRVEGPRVVGQHRVIQVERQLGWHGGKRGYTGETRRRKVAQGFPRRASPSWVAMYQ